MTLFKTCAVALAAALSLTFAGAPEAQAQEETVLERVVDRGSLRVGVGSFVPWAFRSKSGEYIGYEVDVATKLAEDMGVELELVPTAWDGIIPALLTDKFDLIIGGMTVTPARNLRINFTQSYHSGLGQDVVANRELISEGSSVDDLNNPGTVIGVRRGAVSVQAAQQFFPLATLRQYDDEAVIEQELMAGNVAMWITSAPKPAFAATNNPDTLFRPFDAPLTLATVGMGIKKGDHDTLNFLNNWISTSMRSGFLQERSDYWYGSQDWRDQVPE
ncbi:transporter substrate-binding domain-containing protein [Primorskyibacter sp. S187A]|uniref:transporter substrate-binding domain-containing protein n=1 Tax=Primorskyibacter sp. S187A TaxID=3415130 RepID=UPI003C7C8409